MGGREVVTQNGRPVGKRGAQTRRRLIDATRRLLEDHGIRDLRVVDIAREVGTSPATFYQYFADVEDAVLALAAEIGNEVLPLVSLLDEDWDGTDGLEPPRRLVEGFVEYWDNHRAVLRTRNLSAQEGDIRFREVRNRTLNVFTQRFTAKIAASQAEGRVVPEITAAAAAAALVALIERMAAFHRDLELYGVKRADLVETTARILHQTVTGR